MNALKFVALLAAAVALPAAAAAAPPACGACPAAAAESASACPGAACCPTADCCPVACTGPGSACCEAAGCCEAGTAAPAPAVTVATCSAAAPSTAVAVCSASSETPPPAPARLTACGGAAKPIVVCTGASEQLAVCPPAPADATSPCGGGACGAGASGLRAVLGRCYSTTTVDTVVDVERVRPAGCEVAALLADDGPCPGGVCDGVVCEPPVTACGTSGCGSSVCEAAAAEIVGACGESVCRVLVGEMCETDGGPDFHVEMRELPAGPLGVDFVFSTPDCRSEPGPCEAYSNAFPVVAAPPLCPPPACPVRTWTAATDHPAVGTDDLAAPAGLYGVVRTAAVEVNATPAVTPAAFVAPAAAASDLPVGRWTRTLNDQSVTIAVNPGGSFVATCTVPHAGHALRIEGTCHATADGLLFGVVTAAKGVPAADAERAADPVACLEVEAFCRTLVDQPFSARCRVGGDSLNVSHALFGGIGFVGTPGPGEPAHLALTMFSGAYEAE